MNSAEAREYVRLATTETKGLTKTACDLLIDESIKLSKIDQIVERFKSQYDHTSNLDLMIEIKEVLENDNYNIHL